MTVDIRLKQTPLGPIMYLPHDQYVGRSIDLYQEFSSGEAAFFKFAIKGGSVIDVGANIGAHSVLFAKLADSTFAFEPQNILFRLLCANLSGYSNAYTYNAAVGNDEGIVWLPSLDYSVKNNFGGLGVNTFKQQQVEIPTVKTQLRKLDKVEAIQQCDKIDLIKVDVEGMEKDVLEGAQATIDRYRPILYVENDKPGHSRDLVTFIYNLGYRAWWHITFLYNADNPAKNTANVFPGLASFNLICLPEGHWMQINNAIECTPTNYGPPEGCKI